jgi:hypothetical protein
LKWSFVFLWFFEEVCLAIAILRVAAVKATIHFSESFGNRMLDGPGLETVSETGDGLLSLQIRTFWVVAGWRDT